MSLAIASGASTVSMIRPVSDRPGHRATIEIKAGSRAIISGSGAPVDDPDVAARFTMR
jgi:hypothetical protein